METKESTYNKKLEYVKPEIKEEVTFEQKALACAPAAVSQTGGQIGCSKPPGTPGPWWS